MDAQTKKRKIDSKLDAFFGSRTAKKSRSNVADVPYEQPNQDKATSTEQSTHPTYPYPIPLLPPEIAELLQFVPAAEARAINDKTDLDLLYFQPFIPKEITTSLFEFLRKELFFYRVKYKIKRGPVETQINTPRFTTVFGLDETARFSADGSIVDAASGKPLPGSTYKCRPRPLPDVLDSLRKLTENATGCSFNVALVNYYATGDDSISYHSDDERFLGANPAIASFSLGARRDFLMKHKPTERKEECETKPMKLELGPGDMVLMQGRTQSNWLHSIPKRKRGEADKGRINITFRRAMVKGGTENYYRYNVLGDSGDGEVFSWNAAKREMTPWKS
ncbi:hypothetical protein AMS68_002993 [Peltaster fructicola]|uniref:Fe2OG dioxygenase domain-containing protein n=1 Tax=Peltaster fructicola TaxID=286661 RepID=A0A6H0XS09_9PEZI|nr:hypothetical protein AMS68_002993 [Peltaster fructicola]